MPPPGTTSPRALAQPGTSAATRAPAKAFGIAALLATAAGGLLWWGLAGRPAADSPSAPSLNGSAETDATPPSGSRDAAADPATDALPTSRVTRDERLVTLSRKMADFGYDKAGRDLVEDPLARGLARTDSERVIAQAMRDMTACALDALRAQATTQSVSFDAVLDALEADEFYFLYRPEVVALLDVDALRRREDLCTMSVRQQIGLPSQPVALQPPRAAE